MNAPARHRESHCVEERVPVKFLRHALPSLCFDCFESVAESVRAVSGRQTKPEFNTYIHSDAAPRAHDARSHTVQYRATQRGKNWASTKSMKLRQRRQLIQDVGHAASCLSLVIYDTRRGGPVRAHVDHIWWQRLLARRSVGQTCGQRLLARRSARGGLRSRAGCGHGSGS